MSLHDFLDGNNAFNFGSIVCNNLNCNTINGQPPSGGGNTGGGVAGAISYTSTVPQTVSIGGNTLLILGTSDAPNTFGTTNLQAVIGDGHVVAISNSGTSAIFVLISGFVSFTNNSGSGSSYALWVERNGNVNDRYGCTETTDDNDFVTLNLSCSMQLAVGDSLSVVCWTNNPNGTSASSTSFPGLRLTVAQLNEGSGGGGGGAPTLASVLASGNDGNAQSITNVQSVNANYQITAGNSVANSGILTAMSKANQYQIIADSGSSNLIFQQYSTQDPKLLNQPLVINYDGSITATANGVLQVTDGTNIGRVYDSKIFPPPSSGGGGNVSFIAYNATTAQPIAPNEIQPVFWNLASVNSYGAIGLTVTPVNGQFLNGTSSQMLLQVDGYITWDTATNSSIIRDVSILKNNNQGQTVSYNQGLGTSVSSFAGSVLLNAGDFFAVNVFQTDKTNTNISNGSGNVSRINVVRLV